MSQTAAHRVDHVIPQVPVRQWVLSLPIPLRLLLTSSIEALVGWLRSALAPGATCAAQPIAVPCPGARAPRVIDGALLPEAVARLHARAAIILIVIDPQAQAITPQRAAALFGLTRVWARLAASIAGGAAVRDAAEAVGISEAHARQRLKSIFEKTGTRRQAKLAASLTGLG
jgi:hypothetical protein